MCPGCRGFKLLWDGCAAHECCGHVEKGGYNRTMGVEVATKLTFEQFRQLPEDGKRYELVRGEVHLTPSPTTKHQIVLARLYASLEAFLSKTHLGRVLFAPLDVRLTSDTALQPD